jgi:hypothetical protein
VKEKAVIFGSDLLANLDALADPIVVPEVAMLEADPVPNLDPGKGNTGETEADD